MANMNNGWSPGAYQVPGVSSSVRAMNSMASSAGYGSGAGKSFLPDAGGVIGYGLGFLSDTINYYRQKKLMKLQNDYNVAQWNRQNEYDSPAAQMQRLQAAGLNPDLVYSQLGNGQPAQMMATEQNVSSGHGAADYAKGVAASAQMRQLALQERSVDSQIKLNESLADKYEADAGAARANEGYRRRLITAQDVLDDLRKSNIDLNDANARVMAARVNEIGEHIELMKSQGRLNDAETLLKNIEAEYKGDWMKAQIAQLKSQARLNDKNVERVAQIIEHETEMFVYKLQSAEYQANSDWAQMVVDYAAAAGERWKYLLDENGRPYISNTGAAVQTVDILTGFLGRILGMNVNTSSFRNKTNRVSHNFDGDGVITGGTAIQSN